MRANVFTYLDGRSRNESRLCNKNYLALPRNRKDSRLKNSVIITVFIRLTALGAY